jgi:ribosomal protein L12E/L44/L45/RPP1/RPP2
MVTEMMTTMKTISAAMIKRAPGVALAAVAAAAAAAAAAIVTVVKKTAAAIQISTKDGEKEEEEKEGMKEWENTCTRVQQIAKREQVS